ncbi:MAG: serine/threonine-protein kinase [Thermomicrobiales bacterium]
MVDSTTTTRIDEPASGRRFGGPALVAGRYEVELDAPLGSGGMALVYRGRDLRTRRTVAMRTLRPEYHRDPAIRARFRHETRLQAFASHPNIARVFDLHEDGDAPWAVHELVPGTSLFDLLRENGPFAPEDVANVLDQLGAALTHLHGRGLVHLDVKPRNVLVNHDGMLKLIDFGLAQSAGSPQESIGGATFGTAAYLSPEQATGEPVGPASDIYALGCVVYELLIGSPPFTRDDDDEDGKRAVIEAHLHETPVPPSEARPDQRLTGAIDDVVLWALAKTPGERFQQAEGFARLFRSAVEGQQVNSWATTTPVSTVDAPAFQAAPAPRSYPRYQPPIQDEPEERLDVRPGLGRRIGKGFYRLGGRMARRTRWLRRLIWRLTMLIFVANLILAGVIYAARGPGGLLPGGPALEAGGRAWVVEDTYTVRFEPGLGGAFATTVAAGDEMDITGGPTMVDNLIWWPVRLEQDGEETSGYIAQDGIAPEPVGIGSELLAEGQERLRSLQNEAEAWLTGN